MFFLKQKFGILPMRAINELDRGSSVSQSGAFSFATELPPPLPWLTRASAFLPVSARKAPRGLRRPPWRAGPFTKLKYCGMVFIRVGGFRF
jgi:hypothetical protein